jgi:DNA-binding LacI/PurR family transcriptional regulator
MRGTVSLVKQKYAHLDCTFRFSRSSLRGVRTMFPCQTIRRFTSGWRAAKRANPGSVKCQGAPAEGTRGQHSMLDINQKASRPMTIIDLAKDLGMSRATVSRAFHEHAVINRETREKVLKRAKELGFQPNPLARGLITKSTRIVGLVVSDITNPFYPEVVTKLTERLQAEGFNVMLVVASPSRSEEEAVRALLSYRIDIVVMLATTLSSAGAATCRAAGTPVLFFNRYESDDQSYAVTCDNELGGRVVADFLINQGHKRLGYIAGRPDASTNVDRRSGFLGRCAERGISKVAESRGVVFSYEAGCVGARKLLSLAKRPTAIFCANDILALGAIDVAQRELKLKVPDDLSVVGFDDIGIASWPSHSLTTVRQPIATMINLTADLTLALARGTAGPPAIIRLPGTLIERSTTRGVR